MTPRALVLLDKLPLAADSGGKQRALHLALATGSSFRTDVLMLADLEVASAAGFTPTGSAIPGAPTWLTPAVPPLGRTDPGTRAMRWAVLGPDHAAALEALRSLQVREHYDLVVVVGLDLWSRVGEVVSGPVVLDVDNRLDQLSTRLAGAAWRRAVSSSTPILDRVRALRRVMPYLWAARRWRQVMGEVAHDTRLAASLYCFAGDAEACPSGRGAVVRNGVDPPDHPVGRGPVGDPPTILFPGKMTWAPNEDAARFVAREVLPRVKVSIPTARLEIVGTAGARVRALGELPDVEVTGYVEHMTDALARADCVIAPLRSGSGTRIKILEAWSQRIPVVATTIGAEGLDAVDGEDLLIGDGAAGLAAACVRVLRAGELRVALAERGARRVQESFLWSEIERGFVEILQRAAADVSGAGPDAGRRAGR